METWSSRDSCGPLKGGLNLPNKKFTLFDCTPDSLGDITPMRLLRSSRRDLLICLWICLFASTSTASAGLITFQFEAELVDDLGPSFPFALGQKASGSYTFEVNTVPDTAPQSGNTTFTRYSGALTNFTVTIDGHGTGTGGSGGDILLGDPVRTGGSFNFFSDNYHVNAPAVTGITVASSSGARNLLTAGIRLQDLDQQGLDSEILSAIPPDLAFFLDNTGPTFDSDRADLNMNFDLPSGGFNTASFQLTSLTSIPEPGSAIVLLLTVGLFQCRRRRVACNK